jgi:hypothetical protein
MPATIPVEEKRTPMARKAIAAALFIVSGALLVVSGFALSNLFDEYKDSPDSTYLEAGLIPLAFAALCLVAGVLSLRER